MSLCPFSLCVGLHACRPEYLLHKWKKEDLLPLRRQLKRRNSTLQNNKGIIHVLFSCLTCKLLRSEFPQISNKFKTADHTVYKASGDTSGNMVGSRECQHTRRWKAIIRHQLQMMNQHFIHFTLIVSTNKNNTVILIRYWYWYYQHLLSQNADYYTHHFPVTFTSILNFILFILFVPQIQDISLTLWYYRGH